MLVPPLTPIEQYALPDPVFIPCLCGTAPTLCGCSAQQLYLRQHPQFGHRQHTTILNNQGLGVPPPSIGSACGGVYASGHASASLAQRRTKIQNQNPRFDQQRPTTSAATSNNNRLSFSNNISNLSGSIVRGDNCSNSSDCRISKAISNSVEGCVSGTAATATAIGYNNSVSCYRSNSY